MADYIDRQAAIAALDKFAEDSRGSGAAGVAFAMAAMAKSVISGLPSPWVSMEERTPETDEHVFAVIRSKVDNRERLEMSWHSSFTGRWVGCREWEQEYITHWMPQPDMPGVVGVRNAEQTGASYADNQIFLEA